MIAAQLDAKLYKKSTLSANLQNVLLTILYLHSGQLNHLQNLHFLKIV
jgi:hypothetical protein